MRIGVVARLVAASVVDDLVEHRGEPGHQRFLRFCPVRVTGGASRPFAPVGACGSGIGRGTRALLRFVGGIGIRVVGRLRRSEYAGAGSSRFLSSGLLCATEAPFVIAPDACDESILPCVTGLPMTGESMAGVCKDSSMPALASAVARWSASRSIRYEAPAAPTSSPPRIIKTLRVFIIFAEGRSMA